MPGDGRFNSLGRCKGTIRIGSFMRGTVLFTLRVTFLFVMFFTTRFKGHLRSTITITNRHFITDLLRSG
jgi:hypothetical protein